ncbi:cytochrome P450 monooxygenase [Fusarium pseudocircinatum]|uniref:Cytochrome P450 monooxygenase n=1 Tax=Fusarium pseudocircinatum TaxID=56676 RepID=A0A8H5P5V3_9HYPO|nr:cytochrome P450 monooxygenase [Fusarium pseudocircinatum]
MSLNIESFIIWATSLPILLQTSTVVGSLALAYIVYYRYLHPLANYPGPLLASVTNLWKTYHLWSLHLPHTLVRLHEKYGDISIKEMEHFVDDHIVKLRRNLDHFYDTNQDFDLKHMIAFYVFDVLGELAFSRSFNSQDERDLARLPPINDHVYLAYLMGMTPDAVPWIKKVLPFTAVPWLRRLFSARAQLRDLAAACVRQRIEAGSSNRKDLLSFLLGAVDPETGSKLTRLDINTEAFDMIIAGSHTTSGTLTLLFSHLLQNPETVNKVTQELDSNFSNNTGRAISYEALEKDLPYTWACILENLRINPVFTMPLPRMIMTPGGLVIQRQRIPQKTTVFALNHVVHHNPSVWGKDHD